ncbi:molybdate transport system ATP-binding protein [Abditibacterium utsteinense]|uniref:Molybdate transport system ATP-binding protein n=1 Tax=Abditibacterium utsteinense TaxID=1960156 RepID=A0A2S8SPZ6_9BACT|nr:ATP-binding cassette domain-containing protein [Abditibacterium utsteinense]PQV62872.1 molybdate transport system ATP-binding protein [Abditibacterium utsteinense]
MPIIELCSASVALDNQPILENLSWKLERGAHFAILGGNGSGKSTFLRLIAGRIWPRPHDSRVYDFQGRATWSPIRARQKIALLSPETQERFVRFSQDGADGERGWQLSARTAILAGFFDGELLHQTPSPDQENRADELIADLKLETLAHRLLQTLSQGQLRRVLLARALVSRPEVLLLDEACSGLDAKSRAEMLGLIQNIAHGGQTTLGIATHREEEIVGAIQDVWHLEKARGETTSRLIPQKMKASCDSVSFFVESAPQKLLAKSVDEPLIQLENASVWIDGISILKDLNWELRSGQHFAIEGGNGAGKTTFLRLLRGELYPALGGKIVRFGSEKRRSRADIGREIALFSPSLQARYSDAVSVETAIASGFFDSLGAGGEVSNAMRQKVREISELCDLNALLKRDFSRLSYGQRRRVLLARALVSEPRILLLDEAFDGLDHASRAEFHATLAKCVARGAHLVVTSHHESDYPPFLTHRLRLEAGEIAAIEAF